MHTLFWPIVFDLVRYTPIAMYYRTKLLSRFGSTYPSPQVLRSRYKYSEIVMVKALEVLPHEQHFMLH